MAVNWGAVLGASLAALGTANLCMAARWWRSMGEQERDGALGTTLILYGFAVVALIGSLG